jgi:outer membrane protein assembly factor BamD (BamD/ComL family)
MNYYSKGIKEILECDMETARKVYENMSMYYDFSESSQEKFEEEVRFVYDLMKIKERWLTA